MKELVKPIKIEEEFSSVEAYCDNGSCPSQYYSCGGQQSCPGHYGTSTAEDSDIIF